MISVAISSPEAFERSNLDLRTPVMGKKLSPAGSKLQPPIKVPGYQEVRETDHGSPPLLWLAALQLTKGIIRGRFSQR
jgi:hypothetical protein